MTKAPARVRSRSGGRTARQFLRSIRDITKLSGLTRRIPVCEVMDGAHVEMVDAASRDILENVGVQFRKEIAVADWKRVGAKVAGGLV